MTTETPQTEEPVAYIEAITKRYASLGYAPYRWLEADSPPPWAPLPKPLGELRLGIVTTSGCYRAGQVAFHYKDDTSIRRIPAATPSADLRFSHLTENYLVDARRDPDCLVPLAALRRLRDEGVVGGLCDDLVSCMGGVYSHRRVREEMIPAVDAAFAQMKADAVLLIPM